MTPSFATLLQNFFCNYLINQKNASIRTVAAYRDTFKLLLEYLQDVAGIRPVDIVFEVLTSERILGFLKYLEQDRKNSIRTRNARLAAIRSFMKYAGLWRMEDLEQIKSIMAIPLKKFHRPTVESLSREEVEAVLNAPNEATWSGQRDRVMLATLYNTGARVTEIAQAEVHDVDLNHSHSIKIHGKGRKDRAIPLWDSTLGRIRAWLTHTNSAPAAPLFPNRKGAHLSRSGIEKRLMEATRTAAKICPSLSNHNVTPHTIRHTTAMHLLQAGVDISIIALWLGHENITTTHAYMKADLSMKEHALSKLQDIPAEQIRFKPTDDLLRFLESL